MKSVLQKLLGINYKTTFAGIVTWLMAIPTFANAVMSVYNHQHVDWLQVAIAVALAAVLLL